MNRWEIMNKFKKITTRYQFRIIIALLISSISYLTVSYIKSDFFVGLSIFSAVFLTIQFIFYCYDNRIDCITKTNVYRSDSSKKNRTSIKIINTGGKTLHLKSGGIITEDGFFIDFDEDPETYDDDNSTNSSDSIFGTHIGKIRPMPNYFFPVSISPGDAKSCSIDNMDILKLLLKHKWAERGDLSMKAVFYNQFDEELSSEEFHEYEISNDFFNLPE